MELADAAAGELGADDVGVGGECADHVRVEVDAGGDGGEVVDHDGDGGGVGDLERCGALAGTSMHWDQMHELRTAVWKRMMLSGVIWGGQVDEVSTSA